MNMPASNRAPYSQEISRSTPACFLFLIDQSLSMEEPLGGAGAPKCEMLADAINGWLENMIIKASGDKGVKDWMEIAVVGYRTDDVGNPIIESALQGDLAGSGFLPISKLNEHPLRVVDKMQQVYDAEAGEMNEFPTKVRVWVDPVKQGGTPMCTALHHAYGLLEQWIANHKNCYPPIVVHITDGEPQDGDPGPYAEPIRGLATDDGNVLMFNCHLSMHAADQIMFPPSVEMLPDQYAQDLYRMSSVLPEPIFNRAVMEGFAVQPGAKGFVFNADAIALVQFLDMGTRIAKQLR